MSVGDVFAFVEAFLYVAAFQHKAAGFVVGGNDNEGVAVLLGEVEDHFQHLFKVGEFGFHICSVVVVAAPVDLRTFNHHHEAFGVLGQNVEGLFGAFYKHGVSAWCNGTVVVLAEECDQFVAFGFFHFLKAVGYLVAVLQQCVEGVEAVLAVLGTEVGQSAANHHVKAALRHMHKSRITVEEIRLLLCNNIVDIKVIIWITGDDMNKRGFTLIELLGCIVILGLISLLAFPPMLNFLSSSQKKNR